VLADLQLQWAQRDPYTVEHLRPYLGEERWRRLYPARTLAAAGALLCGGSDWPVDPLLPFKQISGAVLRGAVGGKEPLHPEEAISLRAALEMHTRNSAYQLHQEDRTGRIAPGLAADLAVLDRDLLATPAEEIAQTRVVLTFIGGRIVHRAG
jgi:predicted amidohydrolase YtcJ